jgi:deoxyribodipyrimidine photolyase-related protein
MTTLRLLLGDQLNEKHSWFQKNDDKVLYVMMEVRQETDYVAHHIQKIAAFFAAMRNFAQMLRLQGHQVVYLTLENPENQQNIPKNLLQIINKYAISHFEYQLPDEYRLDEQLRDFCKNLPISSQAYDTEHFLSERETVAQFFGSKNYLLESFYRMMRKKYNLLMQENGEPIADKWNFDAENRQKYKYQVPVPQAITFQNDVRDILQMIEKSQIRTIGFAPQNNLLNYPISREQALALLYHFSEKLLPHFGTYEDAMHTQEPHLFHSRLSFVLNAKMLHPLEVLETCIAAWQKNPDRISIAQIEGFVRQILGWREYMRGVYWAKMPAYSSTNFFNHTKALPQWFWSGKTKMNCAKHAVGQSLTEAYAHHIQRLMITGNLALLLGCSPDEVDQWYLGIYIDAIEWVEITNTRGMSQYADGGLVASKPYTASANYIDKMSNYCENCFYDKKKRYGAKACPFNSLYWDFHIRHQEKLSKNPRIGMVYKNIAKMPQEELAAIQKQAAFYKENQDDL